MLQAFGREDLWLIIMEIRPQRQAGRVAREPGAPVAREPGAWGERLLLAGRWGPVWGR